jgi:transposase-like protein
MSNHRYSPEFKKEAVRQVRRQTPKTLHSGQIATAL